MRIPSRSPANSSGSSAGIPLCPLMLSQELWTAVQTVRRHQDAPVRSWRKTALLIAPTKRRNVGQFAGPSCALKHIKVTTCAWIEKVEHIACVDRAQWPDQTGMLGQSKHQSGEMRAMRNRVALVSTLRAALESDCPLERFLSSSSNCSAPAMGISSKAND